jgi:murein DD-endopeptidase MepM/ murein hydrolase activator NlpD
LKRGFPQTIKPLQPAEPSPVVVANGSASKYYRTSAQLEVAPRISHSENAHGILAPQKTGLQILGMAMNSSDVGNWMNPMGSQRNRRSRTSAAMVGIAALSVGAAGLSVFWNNKSALAIPEDSVATEPLQPISDDNALETVPEGRVIDSSALGVEPLGASFSSGIPDVVALVAPEETDLLSPDNNRVTHVVTAGQSFTDIAELYGVAPQVLADANYLPLEAQLSAGQIIRIPLGAAEFSPQAAQTPDFSHVPLAPALSVEDASLAQVPIVVPGLEDSGETAPTFNPLKGNLEDLKNPAKETESTPLVATVPGLSPETALTTSSTPTANNPVVVAAAPTPWQLSDLVPYRVQPGDTLDSIARKYAVSRTALIQANNLQNPNLLRVNQLLGIPQANPAPLSLGGPIGADQVLGQQAIASNPQTPAQPLFDPLAFTNPLSPQATSGNGGFGEQNLGAPGSATSPTDLPIVQIQGTPSPSSDPSLLATLTEPLPLPTLGQPSFDGRPGGSTYAVRPGDTLASIARRHQVSLQELARLNGIANPNLIFVSQRLTLPAGAAAGSYLGTPALGADPSVAVASRSLVDLVPALPTGNPQNTLAPTGSLVPGVVPETQQPGLSPQGSSFSPHIQSLLGEIHALQAKYRTGQDTLGMASPVQAGVVVAEPTSGGTEVRSDRLGSDRPSPTVPQAPVALMPVVSNPGVQTIEPQMIPVVPAPTAAPEVALLSVNERVNPEFQRQGMAIAPEAIGVFDPIQSAGPRVNEPVAPIAQPLTPEQQLVAAAPLGSENYEPLVQSLLGQQVSPQLPPLSVDPYLPKGVAQGYIWPAQGTLTSGFGWRWGRMHKGVDIAAGVGTPIVAAASGVVTYAGWNSGGYGNLVEVQHADGSTTLYAHNNRILVSEGQRVQQGQQIAEMGSTGYSTGPHLHFEIHPSGQGAVNPMAYLPR